MLPKIQEIIKKVTIEKKCNVKSSWKTLRKDSKELTFSKLTIHELISGMRSCIRYPSIFPQSQIIKLKAKTFLKTLHTFHPKIRKDSSKRSHTLPSEKNIWYQLNVNRTVL